LVILSSVYVYVLGVLVRAYRYIFTYFPNNRFHSFSIQVKKTKKVKKPKKKTEKQLKNILWAIVSKRIKERDKNICFTSDKYVEGSNSHCGHGTPSSVGGGRLRYHPKNLHCQSYHENVNLGGNGREYYKRQVDKYGQETIDKLDQLKNKYIKVDVIFYQKLIDLYTNGTWEEIELFLES